ncbi:MAG: glycosyltransferase [Gammaproteobacteria bacterium]|uniref:glycosyltransferase n=1 Tax=Rhodoferax sp. TaxID=50421 RepID=UPI001DAA71CB|nr:glycosyltransferase [Rhodoferax sp.]MBU3900573.1 glycosyltransferase [Gammaproteobacteria bacterium]MBU3997357.1 glycosyltransferase [Gammaproteobacteria bacterium]MBU4080018.1 glycosyltransferase [Gammaproteobacteria bacterium]MBU4113474.1 glycosyltransferase [Gammaproteobacteria bacterium]MBU4172096.1 glycosyltransferase [Gammaproteobacteria bacterium]
MQGKLNQWGSALTQARLWSVPGVTVLALMASLAVFILMLTVSFTLGAQIFFAACFFSAALYIRRYAGTMVTLVLLGMSLLASTRYLAWRFSTTLGQGFSADFVWGFGLCMAELFLCVLIALGFAQSVWPLTRPPSPLKKDSTEWPTVDVFIPVHGKSEDPIRRATLAALALEWPRKIINIYLLDDDTRHEIKELAESMGAIYLAHPDNQGGKAGAINAALPETKGELIAVFDLDQAPASNFLKVAAGWFVRHLSLGMIQPPTHFLAPPASEVNLKDCPVSQFAGVCALIRRSMLVKVGGIAPGPPTVQAHTALKFQQGGYGNAWIGFAGEDQPDNAQQARGAESSGTATQTLLRVDHPFLGRTLRWKQRLASLQAMLKFYYAVPRLVFFTAPLAYLLAGVHVVETTPEYLLAYGLPHLVHAHFAQARLQGKSWFTFWTDMRETALAWYLLVPTALTLLRTEFGKFKDAFSPNKTDKVDPFDPIIAWPYATVLALNLAGLGAGVAELMTTGRGAQVLTTMYLGWVICNLMLLAAMLAVAEESRQIRLHSRTQRRQPAMLQLPSGRTLSCVTENFPQAALAMRLPAPAGVEVGATVGLSIFRGDREFAFPARVVSNQDLFMHVGIMDAAQNDFQRLGVAAFSRDQNWPQWLPGRNADRPLPEWLTKPMIAAFVRLLSFIEKLAHAMRLVRLGHWIQKWKR